MTEVPRVHAADPINLLFGGMAKLRPGADDETAARETVAAMRRTLSQRFPTMLEQHR
jgi:hypothetical protein